MKMKNVCVHACVRVCVCVRVCAYSLTASGLGCAVSSSTDLLRCRCRVFGKPRAPSLGANVRVGVYVYVCMHVCVDV